PKDQVNEVAKRALASVSDEDLRFNFYSVCRVISGDALQDLINRTSSHYLAAGGVIDQINKWKDKVDSGFTFNYLKRFQNTHAAEIIASFGNYASEVPENMRAKFVEELLLANPAAAIKEYLIRGSNNTYSFFIIDERWWSVHG